MQAIYIICATVGGTLIVIQFVLTLLGMGGDGDMDAGDAGEADTSAAGGASMTDWLFGVVSLRTVIAGFAFFGLTGWALTDQGVQPNIVFLVSLGAGLVAIFLVAAVMKSLGKFNLDGTVRIERAVGAPGTVYLSIPGAKGGTGKVHVSVQGRSMPYKAVTSHSELPTGSKIVVVKVIGSDTVEVMPAGTLEESPARA